MGLQACLVCGLCWLYRQASRGAECGAPDRSVSRELSHATVTCRTAHSSREGRQRRPVRSQPPPSERRGEHSKSGNVVKSMFYDLRRGLGRRALYLPLSKNGLRPRPRILTAGAYYEHLIILRRRAKCRKTL